MKILLVEPPKPLVSIGGEDIFIDFVHTLLPTALPLKGFYAQYARLFSAAVPLKNAMPMLRKYPLREIPLLFLKGAYWKNRIRKVYLDYANG